MKINIFKEKIKKIILYKITKYKKSKSFMVNQLKIMKKLKQKKRMKKMLSNFILITQKEKNF